MLSAPEATTSKGTISGFESPPDNLDFLVGLPDGLAIGPLGGCKKGLPDTPDILKKEKTNVFKNFDLLRKQEKKFQNRKKKASDLEYWLSS